MFYLFYVASRQWPHDDRRALFAFLASWTFLFSKTVKLWGHFMRYPSDVLYIPIYIVFGYCHGIIKFWGLATLSKVS